MIDWTPVRIVCKAAGGMIVLSLWFHFVLAVAELALGK